MAAAIGRGSDGGVITVNPIGVVIVTGIGTVTAVGLAIETAATGIVTAATGAGS
jgi:hypothetical protein